jgi:hypothetical protein
MDVCRMVAVIEKQGEGEGWEERGGREGGVGGGVSFVSMPTHGNISSLEKVFTKSTTDGCAEHAVAEHRPGPRPGIVGITR